MTDPAEPFDGWDVGYVLQRSYGSAVNDTANYSSFKRDLLSSFRRHTASGTIAFEIFNMDANDLPRQLGSRQFARIEVIVGLMFWPFNAI